MKHIHFDEIDSTNSYLKREFANLENLSFVSASFQNSGHGRENRVWISERENNLLLSYLIKEKSLLEKYECVSMYTAIIVCKFLEKIGIRNVSIKWPNDVYVKDKKIAGILLEGNVQSHIVVGIGLNVFQKEFSNDLRHPATSVVLEKALDISLEKLSNDLIRDIYDFWSNFDESEDMNSYIKGHNYLRNKRVKIKLNNKEIEGIVGNIDCSCALTIKTNNENVKINSGEIEIL